MPLKPKRFLRELLKRGIVKVGDKGKGGHQKILNPVNRRTSELPMHSKEISKGLEHKILKELELTW